jgi:hypothetical protein
MREADRFQLCGGFIDARDFVWIEDHEARCRNRRDGIQ